MAGWETQRNWGNKEWLVNRFGLLLGGVNSAHLLHNKVTMVNNSIFTILIAKRKDFESSHHNEMIAYEVTG